MDLDLDAGQQAVVDHRGGPLRVLGSFGAGTSTALRARAERLGRAGVAAVLLHHRDLVPFAIDLLRRHGEDVSLASAQDVLDVLVDVLDGEDLAHRDEIARAVVGYQTSWLGDEELRVHADAAGELERAERLIDISRRYLGALASRRLVDAAGAVVRAGLALREEEVLRAERERVDELLVDDFQLATFAEARLLTQLAGRDGALVVAGNPGAAISSAPLASETHLRHFDRRFRCATIDLTGHHRSPGVPRLHLADGAEDADRVVGRTVAAGATALTPPDTERAVGREWPLVVVPDATDGTWPRPRPTARWFDEELFHGPDVADEVERDRRWRELERARFRVAITRATEHTVVVALAPTSPFLDELLR